MTDDRKPIYLGDDRRTGETLADHESAYDVLVDYIQGGLAQVAFLAAPALWVGAVTPASTVEIATAAMSALLVTSVLLTAFRGGHLPTARPWPVLTNRRLGTTGWRAFLTRSVYLSSTLLAVTYGGVLAQAAGGSPLANVLVAGAGTVVALVALPVLSAATPRARAGRFGYCLLGSVLAVAIPVRAGAGLDPSGVVSLGVILALATADTRPVEAIRAWRATPAGSAVEAQQDPQDVAVGRSRHQDADQDADDGKQREPGQIAEAQEGER